MPPVEPHSLIRLEETAVRADWLAPGALAATIRDAVVPLLLAG